MSSTVSGSWGGVPRELRQGWAERLEAASQRSNDGLRTMERAQVVRVARGGPAEESQEARPTVRVFLSSTFTDTRVERDLLIADAYPYLRALGRRLGVEFLQPSEMRWGIHSSASAEHQTSAICVHEVQRCLNESSGLAFVLLLGDKFGFARVPASIESSDFARVVAAAPTEEERAVLKTWFVQDTNSIPNVHELRRVAAHEDAEQFWAVTYPKLRSLLRAGADVAFAGDAKKRDMFYESVTEEEVRNGILELADEERPRRAFVFHRVLADLEDQLETLPIGEQERLANYVDMGGPGEWLNSEARLRLTSVVTQRVVDAVPAASVETFHVELGPGQIDQGSHDEYLHRFVDAFCSVLASSIEECAANRVAPPSALEGRIYNEAASHNAYVRARASSFLKNASNQAAYAAAESYLVPNEEPTAAFVVHAESGAGKTSFMASLAASVLATQAEAVVISRFLGTTIASSTGRGLLTSLCNQIALAFGTLDASEAENMASEDLEALGRRLTTVLPLATAQRPLYLFLDALDQLSPEDNALALEWLPARRLPPHVRLVVSVLPDEGSDNEAKSKSSKRTSRGGSARRRCLAMLREALPPQNVASLDKTSPDDGLVLVKSWLRFANRSLTPEQEALVVKAARKTSSPTPLYFNLVFNAARLWRSYTARDETRLFTSVHEAVNAVFNNLHRGHGETFVRVALGLLTAAPLTENELIDILSLNDAVLDAVFEWWTPPIRRLPPLVWTRLGDGLAGYLTKRSGDDGSVVLAWFHRQFLEQARKTYLDSAAAQTHQAIADYFDDAVDAEKKLERFTTPQPLYLPGNGDVNERKVRMLPFHLRLAGNLDRLKEVLLDLDMLDAALNLDSATMLRVLEYWREALGGNNAASQAYLAQDFAALRHRRAVGKLMRLMGRYHDAVCVLRPALGETVAGDVDAKQMLLLKTELADALNLKSDYAEAEVLYLEVLQAIGDSDPEQVVDIGIRFGQMLVHLGRYAQARERFEVALANAEALHGPDHLLVASVCEKYADLLRTQVRFDPEASNTDNLTEELFARSVSIRKRLLGDDHLDTAQASFGLARFFLYLRRFDEARELLNQVAACKLNLLGKDHPDVTQVEYNIGVLETESGNFALAEQIFRIVLTTWCKTLGDDHPYVATALQAESKLFVKIGRVEDAKAALRRCLEIREHRFSVLHPRYLDAKRELDAMLEQTGPAPPDGAGASTTRQAANTSQARPRGAASNSPRGDRASRKAQRSGCAAM